MKKHFNEFPMEIQNDLIQHNFEVLNKLNQDNFYNDFISLMKLKQKDMGLTGYFSMTKNYEVAILNSSFSIGLIGTIDKLIKVEAKNMDIVKMLEKSKIACNLMKHLTENALFAKIESMNEMIFISYNDNRRTAFDLDSKHIKYFFEEIKKYTQNSEMIKEIKKVELQNMYGDEIDYIVTDAIIDTTLQEIKTELKFFEAYIKYKVRILKLELQNYLDNAFLLTTIRRLLENRTDILFDENDYSLSYVNGIK
jgi:hypothetical protein